MTISADHELAAPFVDAVNTFYGRGDIPIGVVGQGGVASRAISSRWSREGRGRHFAIPHHLLSGRSAPSRDRVLRKGWPPSPIISVVIAQVGFSTNLARLLDSPADEHSPMTGAELVKRRSSGSR